MLTRRGLIAGSAMLAMPAAAITVPPPGLLRFDVLRNNSRIGQHIVRLQRDGAVLRANISVEIAVGIGPVTLFRYTHTVREEWQDARFMSMESETNDDGTRHRVRAESTAEGVVVRTGDGKRVVLSPETIPLTHWNSLCMRAPLFNPQTGAAVRPTVLARGEESIALADGRSIRARRYTLSGDIALDDWYDSTHSWVALDSIGRDGSRIAYRRAG